MPLENGRNKFKVQWVQWRQDGMKIINKTRWDNEKI